LARLMMMLICKMLGSDPVRCVWWCAILSEKVVKNFPSDISSGICYGWACAGNGDLRKMVLSIGWNPFYKNIKQSVIAAFTLFRILSFSSYELLEGRSLVVTAPSLSEFRECLDNAPGEALISAIQEDAEEGKRQLDLAEHLQLKDDKFFHLPEGKT
ncbi:PREDICTED: riboflavin kinase-like, partial [Chlamydotis macqueenii]|uniref:riboflavin kinase-like n=1 Tax=Chlamydotis macqueenii TaxID=187382 RepID=UPI0005295CA8